MSKMYFLPFRPAFDSAGITVPGSQHWFTLAGTNTPSAPFTDATLATPLENPVISNGIGYLPPAYLNPAISYRVRVYDAGAEVGVDVPLEEYDPYVPALANADIFSDLADDAGSSLLGFLPSGTGAVARTNQAKLRDIVGSSDYSTPANARTASNNLLPIVDTATGSIGYQDTAFSITKAQAPAKFKAFQTIANATSFNAFQSITVNGTVVAGTNANFLATANSDNVNFSGWGVRGGAGSSPLVVANFGVWIENNSAIAWAGEVDVNNEGATQAEGSDSGGVGVAINTGSTYSPDTALWVRRMAGAGSGPGFLRGVNIEGARNVGVRVMAMDTTTYPSLTPAAPGTVTAFATGKSSDAQYRFTVNESGAVKWGPGGSTVTDTTLQRTGVNALTASGSFAATQFFVGANQVVGARDTGWAADTGTAKKTATATYAVGSALTVGAAYVQAEVTAIITRQALIEAALRDATQEIKAMKDLILAHGLAGA